MEDGRKGENGDRREMELRRKGKAYGEGKKTQLSS